MKLTVRLCIQYWADAVKDFANCVCLCQEGHVLPGVIVIS